MRFIQDVVAGGAVGSTFSLDLESLIPSGRAGLIAVVIVLAVVAILALLVAAAAYENDRRRQTPAGDDSELFTTTPLPMPPEELARMAADPPPHYAFRQHRIPRWVQAGSVIAALAITLVVAQRLRPVDGAHDTDRGDATDSVPGEDVETAMPLVSGDASEEAWGVPFAFRAREWVATLGGRGCTARLEAVSGAPAAWELRARVHDTHGAVLDSARARVGSLSEGTIIAFAFPRTPCGRIEAWEVAGRRELE